MKYMRKTAGDTWTDYNTNTAFLCLIEIELVLYLGLPLVH